MSKKAVLCIGVGVIFLPMVVLWVLRIFTTQAVRFEESLAYLSIFTWGMGLTVMVVGLLKKKPRTEEKESSRIRSRYFILVGLLLFVVPLLLTIVLRDIPIMAKITGKLIGPGMNIGFALLLGGLYNDRW